MLPLANSVPEGYDPECPEYNTMGQSRRASLLSSAI